MDDTDTDTDTDTHTDTADDAQRPAAPLAVALHAAAALAALAAVAPPVAPPSALAVVGGALAARPAGRSLLRPAFDATAAAIHAGRAAALADLTAALGAAEWAAPTRLGRPVQEVLAHLVGQLERTATELGAGTWIEPSPGRYEHWATTEPYVARLGRGRPGALVDALADVNARLATRLGVLDVLEGAPGDLASPHARALVKVFELWMHADDVRLAVGVPVEVPDAGTLGTLCTLAADIVPVVMDATGRARPEATVRLVLTGRGGGVWRRRLAPGLPPPDDDERDDATVVAEAHRFCRLFHAQLAPDALGARLEGDTALAAEVLAAAGALAERT